MNKTFSTGFMQTSLLDKIKKNKESIASEYGGQERARSVLKVIEPTALYSSTRLTSSSSLASTHRRQEDIRFKSFAGVSKAPKAFLEPSLDMSKQMWPFVL